MEIVCISLELKAKVWFITARELTKTEKKRMLQSLCFSRVLLYLFSPLAVEFLQNS